MRDMCYDRPLYRYNRNQTEKIIYDGCNVDQVIAKLSQPCTKRKNRFLLKVQNIVNKTGKPFPTAYGLVNPIKLDLSNVKAEGLSKKK